MKTHLRYCFVLMICSLAITGASRGQTPQRTVAITIDDLPAASANNMTGAEIFAMTSKLLTTLRDQKVPAIGFVNEDKLYKLGDVDDRIKALNLWLDDGFELGNHTFAHTSLNRVPLPVWEEEVIRGETVTKYLLAQHKMNMRFLRYPYLDAGLDLQTRREAEAFLTSRGYHVAPVTMDAWDWMYGGIYEDARKQGDTALQQKLLESYLSYTTTIFDYFEKQSKNLFGYEPKQVLLLHATWLEADHIGDLLDLLRKRGYQFISLADAISDPAYSSPDNYVGEGTGSIDHWAITRGQPLMGEPAFPQWVIDKAKELHHSTGTPSY
ncbi:MAG TPA: polysaccharide deacetylase family protein [Verrucomicrobiae bacterium]|jgi:peptidoglycan-N-acetylglucosamine deacetylase|nr:polysaccharide deacetylase family protein [Verrucomicrobiae bacterium]